MADDFALCEYVVPKTGYVATTKFGTIPKASTLCGSIFAQQQKDNVPGPEYYNKTPQQFASKAPGGQFGKLQRQFGAKGSNTPAAGQYEISRALTTRQSTSYTMSKKDRGCAHIDMAINQGKWKPAPGKYDSVWPEPHLKSPRFGGPETESKNSSTSKKPTVALGPGYYNPNLAMTEKATKGVPWSKCATKSFLDMHTKEKQSIPAPGHHGIPETKHEDRKGRTKHVTRLLGDRIIDPCTPRLDLEHV